MLLALNSLILRDKKDPARWLLQFHKHYRCAMCGQILMDDLLNIVEEQQALITVMKDEVEKLRRRGD